MRALLFGLLMLVAACATPPAPAPDASGDSLDAIARDYVALILEIGEREPGYVDAYYGPAEWQQAAKAAPRSLADLAGAAAPSSPPSCAPRRPGCACCAARNCASPTRPKACSGCGRC